MDMTQNEIEGVVVAIAIVGIRYNPGDEVVARCGEILWDAELKFGVAKRLNHIGDVHGFHQLSVHKQGEIEITHVIQSRVGHPDGDQLL